MISTANRRFDRCLPCLIIFFLIFSCSPKNKIDGHIHYRLNSDPTTLDPSFIVDVHGGLISAKIFNGLVRLDENLNIVQDIAKKWEISDNGTTYLFYLKEGVMFSNNREVTAGDFKYSFKRVLKPGGKSPNTWVLDKIAGAQEFMKGIAEDVEGITVIDNYTLMVRLSKPFSPFLHLLTMTAAYVVPEEEIDRPDRDFSVHPVGTGPFLLKTWEHNNKLVLERNDHYFDCKANTNGIVYRIIPEDLTAVTEFEVGNLDAINIPSNELSRYRKSSQWKNLISSADGLNTYYLGFNCSRPPFDNVNLRRAVAHAIDRGKILKSFYEGRGTLADGPVPEMLRTWPPHRLSMNITLKSRDN